MFIGSSGSPTGPVNLLDPAVASAGTAAPDTPNSGVSSEGIERSTAQFQRYLDSQQCQSTADPVRDVDPNVGNWWEGGKEAYKDDKITVKTGVQVKVDGTALPTRKDSIMIKVKSDKEPHVVQFIYREIIGSDGKPIKRTMQTTGGQYDTTTDPKNPIWNTDSAAKPNPYYEASFRSRQDPGELTVSDEPSVEPGPGETYRANFKSFIISDGKVIKEIDWTRSQKDGEKPQYSVKAVDANRLPDWAKKQLKDQGFNDAP